MHNIIQLEKKIKISGKKILVTKKQELGVDSINMGLKISRQIINTTVCRWFIKKNLKVKLILNNTWINFVFFCTLKNVSQRRNCWGWKRGTLTFHFNKKITFYLVSKAAGGTVSQIQRAIKSSTVKESASSHLPTLTDSLCLTLKTFV